MSEEGAPPAPPARDHLGAAAAFVAIAGTACMCGRPNLLEVGGADGPTLFLWFLLYSLPYVFGPLGVVLGLAVIVRGLRSPDRRALPGFVTLAFAAFPLVAFLMPTFSGQLTLRNEARVAHRLNDVATSPPSATTWTSFGYTFEYHKSPADPQRWQARATPAAGTPGRHFFIDERAVVLVSAVPIVVDPATGSFPASCRPYYGH